MLDSKRIVLLTALEGTANYGVDPGAGYQGILLLEGAKMDVLGNEIERDNLRAHNSPSGHVVTQKGWNGSWPVEFKGGGLDGGGTLRPPEFDHLMQASAMLRTSGTVISVSGVAGTWEAGKEVTNTTQAGEVVGTPVDVVQSGTVATLYFATYTNLPADTDALTQADTSATGTVAGAPADAYVYRPTSDRAQHDSVHAKYYRDGSLRTVPGIRLDYELMLDVDGYGKLTFSPTGLYSRPADANLPTDTTYYDVDPSVCNNVAMGIGSLDMSTTALKSLQFGMGNNVVRGKDMQASDGISAVRIRGTRSAGGSIDPEAPALTDWNPWEDWENGTTTRIHATVGTAEGERCRILLPTVQYKKPSETDRDGEIAYNTQFTARGQSGDDEVYFFFY